MNYNRNIYMDLNISMNLNNYRLNNYEIANTY